MKKVLIISPNFPPVNAPEMQRVRMSLPYFAGFGWQASVLACAPDELSQSFEPELLATLPADVPVERVAAWSPRWTRKIGLGNLGWRALLPLWRAGNRAIARDKPDIVYFSTTQFIVHLLAPYWTRRFGVTCVADWQDPWVSDYYERPGAPPPPGGWKYRVARLFDRAEGYSLRAIRGLIAVSPDYPRQLDQRYPWFRQRPRVVLPFGVSRHDITVALSAEETPAKSAEPTIVYTGIINQNSAALVSGFFEHLKRRREAGHALPRLEVYGSSYAKGARAQAGALPLAAAAGVADIVSETPQRIPFFAALRHMNRADAVLVIGSADPAYTPSKIFPVLSLGRPVLAIVPKGSAAETLLRGLGADITILACAEGDWPEAAAEAFFDRLATRSLPTPQFDAASQGYDAASLTGRQCALFDAALQSPIA